MSLRDAWKRMASTMAATSPHLNWLIIRNNNSFLLKRPNVRKPFSTEPNNLTNLSSYRFSGLVHKKALGIIPANDKKGFTVVMKKAKHQHRPNKNTVRVTMKAGPRRSLKKLKNFIIGNKYRYDLKQAALRRASAILRSQKTRPSKKARTSRKLE